MTNGDPARRSRKLLLADSNPSVQNVVREVAEQRGHVLIQATTAAATVILAGETQPDLIVLDLAFADADGRDVLRRLKTQPQTSHIPVVVWSGRDGHESDSRISLDLGAEDYVEKDDAASQLDVAKDDAHLLLLKLERVLLRLDS
ncbi:MAG: response regulator [Polyangiaceae bacterium]